MMKFTPRQEEIIETWTNWLIDGGFVYGDLGLISWNDNLDVSKQMKTHMSISEELYHRNYPMWVSMWVEAERRYKQIPLIEALT